MLISRSHSHNNNLDQVSKLFFHFVPSGVRHIAHKNNIDLNFIKGTGKEGRVTKEDLIKHMEGHSVEKVRSTPAVRAFAKQNNLDINKIKGTGNEGRVTRNDVMHFMGASTPAIETSTVKQTTSSRGWPVQPKLTGVTS